MNWNNLADTYHAHQKERGDALHRHMIDPLLEELLGELHDKTILDAGCGNGRLARQLAQVAKKVLGLDVSPRLIELAESVGGAENLTYRVGDLTQHLDIEDGQFDLVVSSMVLQYLPNLECLAEESYRVLNSSGELVLVVQHPLFQQLNPSVFLEHVSCFEAKSVEQKIMSGKATATVYNRSLSDYLEPFFKVGFSLTKFKEPHYSDELLQEVPRYKEVSDFPRVLGLKFKK